MVQIAITPYQSQFAAWRLSRRVANELGYTPAETLWWQYGHSLNVATLPMAQKAPAAPKQDDLFSGDA